MRTGPATGEQRDLAAQLGVAIPPSATVAEASAIISAAPASARQKDQAKQVGLHLPSGSTYGETQRRLHVAFKESGRRVVKSKGIRAGDLLLRDGQLWEVRNIFEGSRLSLKAMRVVQRDGKATPVPTGERGKVFNAFSFRDAVKVDPTEL